MAHTTHTRWVEAGSDNHFVHTHNADSDYSYVSNHNADSDYSYVSCESQKLIHKERSDSSINRYAQKCHRSILGHLIFALRHLQFANFGYTNADEGRILRRDDRLVG
jgi:hypothetical protein